MNAAPTWNSLPGYDDTFRTILENGITVLIRPNRHSASAIITGYLPSGSHLDPDGKLGTANFTALALTRGSEKRTFQQIFDELESMGATLGFGGSTYNISFSGRALAEDLGPLLAIFTDCLRNPTFPPEYIERLRSHLLTALAIRDQDTSEVASMTFDSILFKGHPYGRPEDGHPDTIQEISRDDLITFHRKNIGPAGMVIVIVGGISPQDAVDRVREALGEWQNPNQDAPHETPQVTPLETTIRHHLPIPGKVQADLVLGTLGPKRNSEDYLPASLGNNILGQFGLMGRIGDVVREKAGLAYYASTSLNAQVDVGSWEVSAGVNSANLQRAIDLILSELERFIREPVAPEELQDSQTNYIGRLPISLESNYGVASALLRLERFQLGLDYYRQYPGMVRKVTVDDVMLTARKYIDPTRICIISAGPDVSEDG